MENPKVRKPLVLFGHTLKYDRNCSVWVATTSLGYLNVHKNDWSGSWFVILDSNRIVSGTGKSLHEAALSFKKNYEEYVAPLFKFGLAVEKPLPATPLPLKKLLNGFTFTAMPRCRKGTEYQVAVMSRRQMDHVSIMEGVPERGRDWWLPKMNDWASWGGGDLNVVVAWRKKSDAPLFSFGLAKFPEKDCTLDTREAEVKAGANDYFVAVQDSALSLTRAKPYVALNKDGSLYAHGWSIRDGAELAIHGHDMAPDWDERVIACKRETK